MGTFPANYFRSTTQWLLRERRDVVTRIDTLQAELLRIGTVKMSYRPLPSGDGIKMSEQAIGFTVTKGSSLARLVQAYIATGGNPYDISGFLRPDTTEWVETIDGELVRHERYPGGGFIAPKSAAYNEPLPMPVTDPDPNFSGTQPSPQQTGFEAYPGGFVDSHRYGPSRLGGRVDRGAWDSPTVNRVMHDVRKWANQEIKNRLQNMEWRIIKLSDLAEQLEQERDEVLLESFAGQLSNLPLLDQDQIDPKRLCQVIIQDMYTLLYETSAGGVPYGIRANVETGFLQFVYPDVPEDGVGSLG